MSRVETLGTYSGPVKPIEAARDLLQRNLRDGGATHPHYGAWKIFTNGLGAYCEEINNHSVEPDDVSGFLQLCREFPIQINEATYGKKTPTEGEWHVGATLHQNVTLPEETPPMDAGHILESMILELRTRLEYLTVKLEPKAQPTPHHLLTLSARTNGTTWEMVEENRNKIDAWLVRALENCGIAVKEGEIQVTENRAPKSAD